MEQSMRKNPMTTAEFFNTICSILKEKRKMPDILDYASTAHNPVPLTNDGFRILSDLDYGGSEGIYLTLAVEYVTISGKAVRPLGTFKTLDTDHEAMHTMAALLADFMIEKNAYVNAHLDDFTWEGADVCLADASGKRYGFGYTCGTMKAALKRKDELLKKYPKVIVRDNAARTEKIYGQEDTQEGS